MAYNVEEKTDHKWTAMLIIISLIYGLGVLLSVVWMQVLCYMLLVVQAAYTKWG